MNPPVVAPKPQIVETVFFDTLKIVGHIVIPLVSALYFILAGALNLPDPEAVVGGLVTADTALNTFIKSNEVKYNASDAKFDGVVHVVETDAKKIYQLALNVDPNLIDQSEKLLLKVVKPLPTPSTSVQWEAPVQAAQVAAPPEVTVPPAAS